MPKKGFKNQWIAISRVGKFKDSQGIERELSSDFLKTTIANFSPSEAPAVIGHPEDNAPAYGWVSGLRLNGDTLEAQFSDTDDAFEEMVKSGRFKKRSASFYLDGTLRHVGFLGARAPAVKGLKEIAFREGEHAFAISFKEGERMGNQMEDHDVEKVSEGVFAKLKDLFKPPIDDPAGEENKANFSEADMKKIVAESLAEAKKEISADFTEKLEARQKEIDELKAGRSTDVVNARKAEIASFVEAIPAEKGKHWLKRIGIADFMESLAEADAADENPAISFSEGEGDSKTDHKFSRFDWFKNYVNSQKSFVEFGEKFGDIEAVSDAPALVTKDRIESLKAKAGMATGGKE